MRWGLLITTFLFFLSLWSCTSSSPQYSIKRSISSEEDIHVVFDIDWTIVSNFEAGVSRVPQNKLIQVQEETYVVRDYLPELIEYLIQKKVKVSFFSGGKEERNLELLSKIFLPNGKSLLEVSHEVKSFNDLTSVAVANPNARFGEKYKKDLRKISQNLSSIVIFDDFENFFNGIEQERNMFYIGPTFKYFESYDESRKFIGEYIPRNFEEWVFDREKLKIIKFQLEEAFHLMGKEKIDFVSSMNKVRDSINLKSGRYNAKTKFLMPYYVDQKKSDLDCGKLLLNFF